MKSKRAVLNLELMVGSADVASWWLITSLKFKK